MVVEYKCPSCGAPLVFDSTSQQMTCEYCETKIDVAELQKQEREKKNTTSAENTYRQEEHSSDFGTQEENFSHYHCQTCGAELLTDEETTATFCNYCGSPTLLKDRLSGVRTPAQLIPFKINKEDAIHRYQKWCRKGPLTPKSFLSHSSIEKISGIYVPFWLYDYHVNAKVNANCTRIRHERRGDTEYVHTDHFRVHRDISNDYQKIPADASVKMPDDMMDCLEPYFYEDLRDFEMPYLSGYLSEQYSETSEELAPRVETRVHNYILDDAYSTMQGYATRQIVNENIHMKRNAAKYTVLPVWMLNCRFEDRDYLIALNGQTGKVVGDRPVDKVKGAFWWLGVTALSALLCFLLGISGLFDDSDMQIFLQTPLYYGLLAAGIGLITVICMALSNRKHMTVNGITYAQKGAFHVNNRRDIYTHTTTIRHKINTENKNNRPGGSSD